MVEVTSGVRGSPCLTKGTGPHFSCSPPLSTNPGSQPVAGREGCCAEAHLCSWAVTRCLVIDKEPGPQGKTGQCHSWALGLSCLSYSCVCVTRASGREALIHAGEPAVAVVRQLASWCYTAPLCSRP